MSSSADGAEDEPPRPARWVPTHVQVTVLRGRGLRGKGKNGTSDVYTIIQVGKEKYCTCVAERTTAPEWQEECSFELPPGALGDGSGSGSGGGGGGGRGGGGGGGGSDPAGGRDLVLTVMHRALIGLDVFLGQAVVPLDKAFQDNVYAKNGAEWVNLRSRWFRLNSKTGKKEKERGEVQATVQFTRNNLTASMYHLAMKDKSHSAFSKLKERMRGKKRSSVDEDTPAAVLPVSSGSSGSHGSLQRSRNRLPSDGGGEEEYEDDEGGEGRRNKMRTFFLRGKLRKSSETRSSTSLGSESSESSSRGGSLSPTAGISVVVSDLSNSPSNSSNLTADNSPEHTDTSPKLSPDHSEFGDECHEITIAVPSLYRNGIHAYHTPPLQPSPGGPVAPAPAVAVASPLGLGLLLKPLPTSLSLQNLSPRDEELPRGPGGAGDGRRWSFDKPGEDEKAAIVAALEKSGPMVGDDEEEEPSSETPSVATGAAKESYERKRQQQQQKKKNFSSQGRSESGGRDGSEQAQERLHKGWFGSKDCHSKPSPVVSPKLGPIPESHQSPPPLLSLSKHPSWGPGAPPVPLSPPSTPLDSPLHHTNPFCHSQSSPPPPPMSPCNPFFSSFQHNPFSGEVRSDPPPPLPYLSSSRPPIAHLFPQEPDPYPSLLRERPAPTDHAVTTSDAAGEGEALSKLKQRPLPPPPADEEERPLSKKSPNPFILSRTSGLDMQWDEAFEAFASCRLQSADDVATGSAQQPEPQKGPEQNSPKGPLLDKEQPPQTTDAVKDSDVNEASHPQNWGCLDTFTEPSSDGFAHLLAAIPATNHQASMLLTASLDSPDNNGGCTDCLTSTTPPLAFCHGCQCTHSPSFPCDIEKPKDCSDSPHPSSSGIGSLAEEDVLSSISSCSASEKLSASSGDDVETKSVNGCTLNPCEESPEQTVVGLLKDSENKLIDCSYPLIIDHKVEGNLIQVINQNEKPQSVISMDKDQWLVPLPVISLGPSPPHVPWSDLSSNHPNISIPSDLEVEPTVSIQCDKTEKTERTCELRESFGDLQDPENNSVLAAKDNEETLPPDILDSEGTSICPSFHTVTSFFGEESSLLERPFGTGSLDQLVRQSSPKPSELIGLNNSQTMLTPIQVFNESTLMETPFGVSISDEQVVHRSSPKPSELLDLNTSQTLTTDVRVFDGTLSSEKWTPSPGSLLSSLYTSTDSQDYQTCLTHNSSTATTTSVDSLVEHPSENLWSSILTLCGADSCGEISLVLPPENISALGVCGPSDMELDVNQEAGVELLTSKDICLSKALSPCLEPSFSVEDFSFHSDTPTDSDISYKTDNDKLGGGTQEHEGEPSAETSPPRSQTECPALQRSHSEGTLATGSSERPLTTYGSSPSVVQALHPNDPSGPPYSTRTPLLFLPPTSCLPAEPTAPLARRALPSATVTALLPSTPGPAPKALTPAPCIATPALDEAHATDAACAVLPPEVPQEKVEHQQNSPHPVRPLTPGPEERRVPEGRSVLASGLEKLRSTIHPGRSSQLSEAEPERRKSLTEGAGSYYHLTHNELVALLVRREAELERQKAEFERQTVLLSRREVELRKLKPQVRDLENYIDTLLVRIMEQTPTLLQVRSKFK